LCRPTQQLRCSRSLCSPDYVMNALASLRERLLPFASEEAFSPITRAQLESALSLQSSAADLQSVKTSSQSLINTKDATVNILGIENASWPDGIRQRVLRSSGYQHALVSIAYLN